MPVLITGCLWQQGIGWTMAAESSPAGDIQSAQGKVQYQNPGGQRVPATEGQRLFYRDAVETLEFSEATLRFVDRTRLTLNERTRLEILPPVQASSNPILDLINGAIYLFSHAKPRSIQIRTRHGNGAALGTEFLVQVEPGRTVVSVFEGKVELSNPLGSRQFQSGEHAVMEPGRAPYPVRLAATNIVQWWLYYPGVLDVGELSFGDAERQLLGPSLAAYRAGRLRSALELLPGYPALVEPADPQARVYYAGVFLATGQPGRAEEYLKGLSPDAPAVSALHVLMTAVRDPEQVLTLASGSASQWLAYSYYQQAHHQLGLSLKAAERAVQISPDFGFGWARLAEVRFGHGDVRAAWEALKRSLELAPDNAQAVALEGFLFAADNRIREASVSFQRAAALDSTLANAWLGQGLCHIRKGDLSGGAADLLTAIALEPDRALLRSYLGKVYSDAGVDELADRELRRSLELDPNDPTAWLYSALVNFRSNRINTAIKDLETSVQSNGNRRLFRSKSLLDEDRAVRGANLAIIYQEAGLEEWSVREAAKALTRDYANSSAHLFLAQSYDALRDPAFVNARYDAPARQEHLLANLLAPVGAGTLSQYVSNQEYSKLLESDGLGFASSSTYLSQGAWSQVASQYGTFGDTSYAIDGLYQSQRGYRRNQQFEVGSVIVQAKEQLTPQNSFFVEGEYTHLSEGDLLSRLNESEISRGRRVTTIVDPSFIVGYQHQWEPGVQTLAVAGRWLGHQEVLEPEFGIYALNPDLTTQAKELSLTDQTQIELYPAEVQQIWHAPHLTSIVGAAFQGGRFHGKAFSPDALSDEISADFWRASGYAYESWEVSDSWILEVGLSYDWMAYPSNFRFPPFSAQQKTTDQLSPKIGIMWTPNEASTVRAAYTRSLGGVDFDQNFRIEPTQVAGLNQSYEDLIPQSVVGPQLASDQEVLKLTIEHRFPTRTYAALSLEALRSQARLMVGALPAVQYEDDYDYTEKTLFLQVDQLLRAGWAVGTSYRVSNAEFILSQAVGSLRLHPHPDATLQELNCHAFFNHPCGFFARGEALWLSQDHSGSRLPGDNFWQFNLFAGYRFYHRHAELSLGLLNATDQDYRLNPLNLHSELPRARTLVVNLRLSL